jgi:hypothetical protein
MQIFCNFPLIINIRNFVYTWMACCRYEEGQKIHEFRDCKFPLMCKGAHVFLSPSSTEEKRPSVCSKCEQGKGEINVGDISYTLLALPY